MSVKNRRAATLAEWAVTALALALIAGSLAACASVSGGSSVGPALAGVGASPGTASDAPAAGAPAAAVTCTTVSAVPACASVYPPAQAATPGQPQLDRAAAEALARDQFAVRADAPTASRLVTFADWVSEFGGGDTAAIDRQRPAWVVSVGAAPTLPLSGPVVQGSQQASRVPQIAQYTVLVDAYSGWVIEFVGRAVLPLP